jgi:prepilin-type N-terminal cleavage/methylation domain-containing protein
MPTSVPGSKGPLGRRCAATVPRGEHASSGRPGARVEPLGRRCAATVPRGDASSGRPGARVGARSRGFTLIELLVVMAIAVIAGALVIVALPDRTQGLLDEEAERLAALLESARTEARASGTAVRWELASADASDGAHFRFIGLPPSSTLPRRWLTPAVSA